MKTRISLILAASLILPALSQAREEIDFSRVQTADISDQEYQAVEKMNFKKYFDGSCQKRVILDLSTIKKAAVKTELQRKLQAKGHQGMINNADDSFPLKTVYFTVATRGIQFSDENAMPFNEKALDRLANKMQGDYQLTLSDLTPLLLSDKEISKQKFEMDSIVSVRMKDTIAPADLIEAMNKNNEEDRKEVGDNMFQPQTFGMSEPVVEVAHTFAKRAVSGIEFKALQLETLKFILAETKGQPGITHMGDVTGMAIVLGLGNPIVPETESGTVLQFIDELPTCK